MDDASSPDTPHNQRRFFCNNTCSLLLNEPASQMGRVWVINSLKLLGYSTILTTHILQKGDITSKIKRWLPAWHGSSAVLLGKDLNRQQNLFTEVDPNRHPLPGACDWARCTVELHEAQIPHTSQIRPKSWIRVCFVPCAPHLRF